MTTKREKTPRTLHQLEMSLHRASLALGRAQFSTRQAKKGEEKAKAAYRKAKGELWARMAAMQAGANTAKTMAETPMQQEEPNALDALLGSFGGGA